VIAGYLKHAQDYYGAGSNSELHKIKFGGATDSHTLRPVLCSVLSKLLHPRSRALHNHLDGHGSDVQSRYTPGNFDVALNQAGICRTGMVMKRFQQDHHGNENHQRNDDRAACSKR